MNISDIAVGDYVVFMGDNVSYPVTHVGVKYFHVDTGDGAISGPYPAELVTKVMRG